MRTTMSIFTHAAETTKTAEGFGTHGPPQMFVWHFKPWPVNAYLSSVFEYFWEANLSNLRPPVQHEYRLLMARSCAHYAS